MAQVPEVCRWVIRMASWLLPAGKRKAWCDHRQFEVWNWWALLEQRGELYPWRKREIYRYCLHSFPEAFWARFDREETAGRIRSIVRGPAFALGLPLVIGLLIGAGSGGFRGLRGFYHSLPYPNADELVLVTQERTFGLPHSVQPHAFTVWQDKAKSLEGIAGFGVRSQYVGEPRSQRLVAGVTTNFFDLVGMKARLGRLIRPGDAPGIAVLANWFWRAKMRADPHVIGRQIIVDGDALRIVGVLPADFGLLPPYVDVVVPADVGNTVSRSFRLPSGQEVTLRAPDLRSPMARNLIGAIARVRPGVSLASAERELLEIGKAERVRYFAAPKLTPLEEGRLTPLMGYFVGLGFGMLIGAGMVQLRRPSFAAIKRSAPRSRLVYWGFFALKAALFQVVLLLGWIEISQAFLRVFDAGFPRDVLGVILIGSVFIVLSAIGVYWAVYDQRWRCPECLERLMLPVRIGSWASPLLEPVTIEVVCEKGHGALVIGETATSEVDHWTKLDDSWKELFSKGKD